MRTKLVVGLLVVSVGLAIALLWLMGGRFASVIAAPAGELHVCPSGCPYSSVQAAVDAASDGDVIKVSAGTYTGVSARAGITQVVYLSKAVTIQGGYTTSNWITSEPEVNITTLDAQGQGRVFYISVEGIPTIAGLHITGGNASNQGRGEAGGGIYAEIKVQIAPPDSIIADNHIYSNTAYNGGGVYLDQGAPFALRGNTIVSNTAGRAGGGMAAHGVEITLINNVFAGNSAALGGGLDVEFSDAVLQGSTFRSNTAQTAGGGVYVFNSTAKFDTSIVVSNTAQRGGGLAIFGWYYHDPIPRPWRDSAFVNTLVADNQASLEGAGIYISGAPLHLWHTTLARNSGGGTGSGVAIGNWNPWSTSGTSTVNLTNTILVSQSVGMDVTDGSTITVNSILWYNTPITISQVPGAVVSVQNQITGNPDFFDPGGGNYHIGAASAARDVGIVTGTPKDMDGQVRPMGWGYDLGADEYSEAALSLVKTPSLVGANVGQLMTYTLVITSSGSQGTTGVVLTDTLDALQRAILVTSSLGSCTIKDLGWGGTVVCTPGTLSTGASVAITLTAQVSVTASLGQAMTNTVVARANETFNSTQATVYAQDCHVRIGNAATEYTSVQTAVDAADPGALVKVAGTCMGVYGREGARQQVYLNKLLTIQGGYTTTNWTTPNPEANPTILDARGLGRVMFIRHVVDNIGLGSVIDGLRITGGNAYGQVGGHSPIQRDESAGGGVYVFGSDPTLSNNHIFGNTAALGGGMYTSFCNLDVRGTTFFANTALGDGGGLAVHAGGAIMIDNRFEANSAENGGGFAAAAAGGGDFTRNTFIGNSARAFGGGLALETAAQIKETLILSNTAERGGGIAFYTGINNNSPYATLINTVIAGNQASLEGAGVFVPSGGAVHLLYTTLARNGGGDGSGVTLGWYDYQGPGASTVVMTNTILASQSVGIHVADTSTVTVNSILWHSTPVTVSQSPSATVVVQNQHTGDPAFVAPAGGDYHIGATSAARDAGVDSGVITDMDGQPRPMDSIPDIGADEYPGAVLDLIQQTPALSVRLGEMLTYTIVVTNSGAGNATGVVLTDTLDTLQRAVIAASSAGGCSIANAGWGGRVVCSPGTLVAGERVEITLTAQVSPSATLTGMQVMTNTVVARSDHALAQAHTRVVAIGPQGLVLTLNLGAGDVPTIDPALVTSAPAHFVVNQLFLGLVRVNDETGEIVPELATAWEMSPDARTFTFTLRSGATWTDGNPVTAYDVRYGILRSLAPATNAGWGYPLFVIQNAEGYNNGSVTDPNQVGVTVLDNTHIRFTLNQAAAYLPHILALPVARTMPAWAITAHPADWTEPANIVTNGPYQLTGWTHGAFMALVKNPGYYGAANAQVDLVSLWMVDDSTAWGMYLTGQLDSVLVPPSQWSTARSDPIRRQELHTAPQLCTYYYGFNTAKAPFNNPLVRKAFIAAVNRQGVIDDVTGYAELPALAFSPPGIFGHIDGLAEGVGVPYSPVQAQQWLTQAGYPNGQGLPPITLMVQTSSANQAIAQYVSQNWLDNLGVTVAVSSTNSSDYRNLLQTDPPQIWRSGWCYDQYDAYNFLYDSVIGQQRVSHGNWSNATYDSLLSQAAQMADLNLRRSLYKQAEEILVETDAVMLPLYYSGNGIATQPYFVRTYGNGGWGGRVADWRFRRLVFLPAVLKN